LRFNLSILVIACVAVLPSFAFAEGLGEKSDNLECSAKADQREPPADEAVAVEINKTPVTPASSDDAN
jgi:hypothetical protein